MLIAPLREKKKNFEHVGRLRDQKLVMVKAFIQDYFIKAFSFCVIIWHCLIVLFVSSLSLSCFLLCPHAWALLLIASHLMHICHHLFRMYSGLTSLLSALPLCVYVFCSCLILCRLTRPCSSF